MAAKANNAVKDYLEKYPTRLNGRLDFSKISGSLELPYLAEIQTESFKLFLKSGIDEVFKEVFPIANYANTTEIQYVDSHFEEPEYGPLECKENDLTYSSKLKVTLRIFNKKTGVVKEGAEVFMGDVPMMTESGTFIVNGAERVIVSQIVRSPGAYFGDTFDTKQGVHMYTGEIIPTRGTWLQFETDSEFYDPEGSQSVAEFIDSALAGDDIHFSNPAYEAAYQAYFQRYDQGMDQDSIVLSLLNGEDRAVASVAAELSTEKYEITVHNFTDALTTVDSWLVKFVPRSILAYHDKRITARQQEISRSLAQASAQDGLELMKQLSKLNELKKTINIKLGRLPK
jgi:DNA-directed RNA polymerase beta subunit